MKNRLKILPEPESIIKDEFLHFVVDSLAPSGKNVLKVFCLDQKMPNFILISNLMSDFVYIAYLITLLDIL